MQDPGLSGQALFSTVFFNTLAANLKNATNLLRKLRAENASLIVNTNGPRKPNLKRSDHTTRYIVAAHPTRSALPVRQWCWRPPLIGVLRESYRQWCSLSPSSCVHIHQASLHTQANTLVQGSVRGLGIPGKGHVCGLVSRGGRGCVSRVCALCSGQHPQPGPGL